MSMYVSSRERDSHRKGVVASTVTNTILVILLLLPLLVFQNPPPGQEGITVNLGLPDEGQGEENAPAAKAQPQVEPETQPEPETKPDPQPDPVPDPKPVDKVKTTKPVDKKVITQENPEVIAAKKRKEAQEKKEKAEQEEARRKQNQEREKQLEADRERQRQENAEKKRKADAAAAAAAAAQAAADKYGGLADGAGPGKGNTGRPGNQGQTNGDPNSDNLKGSGGSGKIGGGLKGRGISSSPKVSDSYSEKGKVTIDICVDTNGRVTKATVNYSGTSTSSSDLKAIAIRNAKTWKFDASSFPEQCGTIRYDFDLK